MDGKLDEASPKAIRGFFLAMVLALIMWMALVWIGKALF